METARDIFDHCCVEIAEHLIDFGFQYRPSQHSAVRANGDLTCKIHFQSSPRNYLVPHADEGAARRVLSKLLPLGDLVTFGDVTLIEHANISSKALKRFRKELGGACANDGAITGGQIGNLQSHPKWIKFNLANPHTRQAVIAEAIHLIESVAFPWLELFNDPEHVIQRLIDGSVPWAWEPSALEYAYCFGGRNQSQLLLNRLVSDSRSRTDYVEAVSQYKACGVPEFWEAKAAGRLAKAAVILGLE